MKQQSTDTSPSTIGAGYKQMVGTHLSTEKKSVFDIFIYIYCKIKILCFELYLFIYSY